MQSLRQEDKKRKQKVPKDEDPKQMWHRLSSHLPGNNHECNGVFFFLWTEQVARRGEDEEDEEEEEEAEEGQEEVSLETVSQELCEPYCPNISIHQ